jgi:hypothetical protein
MTEHRWTSGQRPLRGITIESKPTELSRLIRDLTAELGGPEEFYRWSSTLPAHVVMNRGRYAGEIREKLLALRNVFIIKESANLVADCDHENIENHNIYPNHFTGDDCIAPITEAICADCGAQL